MADTAEKLRLAQQAIKRAKADAEKDGPAIIERVLEKSGLSLRQVARKVGRSPTYLSQVRRGEYVISASCYLALSQLEKKIDGESRTTTGDPL